MPIHKDIVSLYEALDGLEQSRREEEFHHYISLEGFAGMTQKYIKDGILTFHASHVRFSNDTTEFAIGEKEIQDIVKEKLGEDYNNGISKSGYSEVYATCFCKKGDGLLHQWACYGENGGLSIEFDFSNIEMSWWEEENNGNNDGSMINAKPVAVYYDKKEYKEQIEKIINIGAYIDNEDKKAILNAYMALRKAKVFKLELESRLLFWPCEKQSCEKQSIVKYKINRGILVPYLEISLKSEDKSKPIIKSITIGPGKDQVMIFNSVFQMIEPDLSKHDFLSELPPNGKLTSNGILIKPSKIPFRA